MINISTIYQNECSSENPDMEKKRFFLRLNPPGPSFTTEMSYNEKEIVKIHVAYWAPYVSDGVSKSKRLSDR